MRKVFMSQSIEGIITDIEEGKAVAVSDGSFKEEFGTACWIIENELGTERIIGLIDIPGSKKDHDAYRSELGGLYGIVTAVDILVEISKLKEGGIEIGCDGMSALNRAFWVDKDDISSKQAHYDMISGIQGMTNDSKIQYSTRHIKGHQDDIAEADLDKWAILNIECDLRAKEFWKEIKVGYRKPPHTMKKGIWQVKIQGRTICSNLTEKMRESISGEEILEYYVTKKQRMTKDQFHNIDWITQGKALKLLKPNRQHWVSKFTSGWCATGKMMHIWKQRLTSSCPRCNSADEDNTHILACKSIGAMHEWEKSMIRIKEWLDSNNTCPDLKKLVLNIIHNWKLKRRIQLHEDIEFDGIREVFEQQKSIGWRLFLDGCLVYEWSKLQQIYLEWIGSKKTGVNWVKGLIRELWDLQWDAWQHRNSVLHNTPLAELMEGRLSLDRSLRSEWSVGFNNFPDSVVASIPKRITQVMKGDVADKKGWFVLIRTVRENSGDHRTRGEFSDPKSSLRPRVGM